MKNQPAKQALKKSQLTKEQPYDFTPTWTQALNIYLAAIQHGKGAGKQVAIDELKNMANAADKLQNSIKVLKGIGINAKRVISNDEFVIHEYKTFLSAISEICDKEIKKAGK